MKILGIRIDNLGKKEILQLIKSFLREDRFHQIATVNPEFVLRAQNDEEFKIILNSCNLNVADGVGLWYAHIRFFKWLRCRMTGVELMHEILNLANKHELKVFVVINQKGLSNLNEIRQALEKKYPRIKLAGAELTFNEQISEIETYRAMVAGNEIVLCNFGAPMQEKFLNLVKNDTIRLAMGVGGTFDFLTKKRSRAPKIVQKIGLEWLWRILSQGFGEKEYFISRLKRIFKAVVIFPLRVIINK
jgi:N-acetylglucosaminyldiphosphoundecaprenol N-acetyl-beta-D-mannosaminyltransferase